MTTKTEATKRPWRNLGTTIGNKTMVVCSCDYKADPDSDATDIPQTEDEAKANATLICKAVNSHDELVRALETLQTDLENNGEMLRTDESRLELIRAALQQVKGGE